MFAHCDWFSSVKCGTRFPWPELNTKNARFHVFTGRCNAVYIQLFRAMKPIESSMSGIAFELKFVLHITGVANIRLTMYPFSISTDMHAILKFLVERRLSKTTKFH